MLLFNLPACCFTQHNLVAQTGDPDGTGKGGESVFRLKFFFFFTIDTAYLFSLLPSVFDRLLCPRP